MRMAIYRQIICMVFFIGYNGTLIDLIMGRVINSELPANKRKKICQLIARGLEVLGGEDLSCVDRDDIIAFIVLCLREIEKTLVQTCSQWEKRGYWVKSEKFMQEWAWVDLCQRRLMISKKESGWDNFPDGIDEVRKNVENYSLKTIKSSIKFWSGAYRRL